MLGREAIKDADNFDLGVTGDGNRLGVGTGVGIETAPVDVDQDLVAIGRRHSVGRLSRPPICSRREGERKAGLVATGPQ